MTATPLFTPLPTPSARTPQPPAGWPLWRLGFRPFYLLAAGFATLAVPVWMAWWLALLPAPLVMPPMLWHAHEMLFGFACAVIVGFLLTAGKAWTGLPTPRGTPLAALALWWLAARLAAVAAPAPLFAALDLPWLPVVALLLTRLLLRAGNRRNLPLAAILWALSAANALSHASWLGLLALSPLLPLHAALALIVMMLCVMAGRVVPGFTASATPSVQIAAQPRLGPATLVCTGLGLLAWLLQGRWAPLDAAGGALLAMAAALHVARLRGWQPGCTRQRPILWILHLAYAWIPLGLALLAAALWGVLAESAGIHALSVGALSGLVLGMLTRTARGHTGRPLQVSRSEVLAYALVTAAAVLRVLGPLLLADPRGPVLAAALAWSLAFGLYLRTYTPWLLQTRLDGKDG